MKKFLLYIIIVCVFTTVNAQTYSHKEIYDQEFVFTDGIYITKDDMINNHPIEKYRVETNIDAESLDFFDQLMSHKEFSLFDNLGNRTTIKTENVWGYCSGGTIFINQNGYFNRVGVIGSICHFMGIKIITNYHPYDPFFGYNRWGYVPTPTTTAESQQYFLEFSTGKIYEYNSQNLEMLLMKDVELHDEYAALSRKKKNSRLFYYMRKFNEKHPLYLPVYE